MHTRDVRLGLLAVVAGIAVGVLAVFATIGSAPPTAIGLPTEARQVIHGLLPEGWAFFTLNPQTPVVQMFKEEGNAWHGVRRHGALNPSELFGLNRLSREQGLEAGILVGAIPSKAWLQCTATPQTCLSHIPSELSVTDPVPQPTLCGSIGLASQAPAPWAWANLPDVVMPSSVAHVTVTCVHRTA